MTTLFGWSWSRFWPMVVSLTLVMVTLGMNLSAVGLVEFESGDSHAPVVGFFLLVMLLDAVYAITLVILGSKAVAGRRSSA
jgi:hypothetical protein